MIENSLFNDWIPLNKREKLSFGRIIAIASANLVPRLLINIAYIYFTPLCNEVGLASILNLLLLSGSLIEFFLSPFVGAISDGLMYRYGRRRIFIVVGTIFAIISLLLLIFNSTFGKLYKEESFAKKVIFIVSIELIYISITLIQIPARSLCSDLTPLKQQNLMSHVCQFYIAFAPIIPNIINGLQITFSKMTSTTFFLIINSIISFAALIISSISGREEQMLEKPSTVNPFKQMYNSFKKMPKPFKRIVLPYLFSNAALYQFMYRFTDFIGSYIFQTAENLENGQIDSSMYQKGVTFGILCMAVNNGCQLIYSVFNWLITDHSKMKWAMFYGNLILAICLVLVFWIKLKYVYFLIAGLIGVSQVIIFAIPSSIVSIVVQSEELGINLGVLNSVAIIGQQISNLAFAALISFSVSKNKSTYLIGFSSIFALVAALLSLFIVEPSIADKENYNYLDEDSNEYGKFALF